jgi:ABC-type transport system involved in cytochrome c biogenesis ATPase subunit
VHVIGLIEGLLEAHTQNGGMLAMTSHHTVNLVNTPAHHINLSS